MDQSDAKAMSIGRAIRVSTVLATLLLASCDQVNSQKPPEGRLSLKHVASASGTASFDLVNQSTITFWFDATTDDSGMVRPLPYATWLECHPADSLGWQSTGRTMGSFVRIDVIPIAPSGTVRFAAALTGSADFAGGHCRLRMELNGGTSVVSDAFPV
jgi:hypothetical protein